MAFPMEFWHLSILLAIQSIVLLLTSVFLSPYLSKANIRISKKRMKNVALTFSALFLATVAIETINIIIT